MPICVVPSKTVHRRAGVREIHCSRDRLCDRRHRPARAGDGDGRRYGRPRRSGRPRAAGRPASDGVGHGIGGPGSRGIGVGRSHHVGAAVGKRHIGGPAAVRGRRRRADLRRPVVDLHR